MIFPSTPLTGATYIVISDTMMQSRNERMSVWLDVINSTCEHHPPFHYSGPGHTADYYCCCCTTRDGHWPNMSTNPSGPTSLKILIQSVPPTSICNTTNIIFNIIHIHHVIILENHWKTHHTTPVSFGGGKCRCPILYPAMLICSKCDFSLCHSIKIGMRSLV